MSDRVPTCQEWMVKDLISMYNKGPRLPLSCGLAFLSKNSETYTKTTHSEVSKFWPRIEAQEMVWFKKNKTKHNYEKEECGVGLASSGIITKKEISGDKGLHENSYLWNGNSQAINFWGYSIFRRFSQTEEPTLLTILPWGLMSAPDSYCYWVALS